MLCQTSSPSVAGTSSHKAWEGVPSVVVEPVEVVRGREEDIDVLPLGVPCGGGLGLRGPEGVGGEVHDGHGGGVRVGRFRNGGHTGGGGRGFRRDMGEGNAHGGEVVEEAGLDVVGNLILPTLDGTHLEVRVEFRVVVDDGDGRRVVILQ